MRNDFANFSTFFSSQVCNIPPIHVAAPATSALSLRRIGDALFFRNPIRTERSGGRMGSQPTHPQRFGDALLPHQPDRALLTSSPLAVVPNLTARAVTPSVNPRQRRGHTHRRTCAAERRHRHSPAHLFENSVHLSHSFRIQK